MTASILLCLSGSAKYGEQKLKNSDYLLMSLSGYALKKIFDIYVNMH